MNKLDLHPTATAQWQTLIMEAERHCTTKLTEELQSYLVFTLMRYLGESLFCRHAIGIELLTSLQNTGKQRENGLRDVGDQCLLLSGLFPGQAVKRSVRISYFVNLGISAYSTLANEQKNTEAPLFLALGKSFVTLMDVLQATREVSGNTHSLELLQAIELWQDTGSQFALQCLRKYHIDIPFYLDNPTLKK